MGSVSLNWRLTVTNFDELDMQGDEPEHFEDILGFDDEDTDGSIFDTDEDNFDDEDEDEDEDEWDDDDDWPLDDDEFDEDDDESLFDIDDEGEIVDHRENLDVD
jgi:hypothetical protein